MTEQTLAEKWESLTIRDNFIFSKTMEANADLCRQLIELILNIKVKSISYPEREKVIEERVDSKGIRLDVYVEDKDTNRIFDVEMQISDSDNLAKRMRYYQGLIDLDKLKRGQHYSALGESYIIFICPFDKFKAGRHMYTFKNFCEEDKNIPLNDGGIKIFLSTKGTVDDVSADVKAFLNYVDNGVVSGKFVEKINDAVQDVKFNRKARFEYMTYQMALYDSREAGRAEGRVEGRGEGRVEGIESVALRMIKRGKSFDEIREDTNLSITRLKELANSLNDNNPS